jgi:hypothetical protein
MPLPNAVTNLDKLLVPYRTLLPYKIYKRYSDHVLLFLFDL